MRVWGWWGVGVWLWVWGGRGREQCMSSARCLARHKVCASPSRSVFSVLLVLLLKVMSNDLKFRVTCICAVISALRPI